MKHDLTKGNITGHLVRMSVPTMLGLSAQMVYDLVDIFWIGKISAQAVAGVTIFSTLFGLICTLNSIIGQSSVSVISQSFGKGDTEKTNRAIEQTFTFKFFVGLLTVAALVFLLRPLLSLFSEDPVVLQSAMDYGLLRLLFLPIMFSSFSVNTALRCIGDAKTPMKIMFLVNFLNILLDPLFIFSTIPGTSLPGLGLGIFGAALATVISQTLALIVGFVILFGGKAGVHPRLKGLFRLDWATDKKLLTIGLPNGIEQFLRTFAETIILGFVAVFGTKVIAATGVAGRIFSLAFKPLVGLSTGGATIVGQNLGAENVERAHHAAKNAGVLGMASMFLFTVLCWTMGGHIMRLFTSDPGIVQIGAEFLRFGSIGLTILAYGFGMGIVFSGSGFNIPYVVGGMAARWAVQIPILVLTIWVLHLPVIWVWLSFVFSDVAESVIYLLFFRQGRWRTRRVTV